MKSATSDDLARLASACREYPVRYALTPENWAEGADRILKIYYCCTFEPELQAVLDRQCLDLIALRSWVHENRYKRSYSGRHLRYSNWGREEEFSAADRYAQGAQWLAGEDWYGSDSLFIFVFAYAETVRTCEVIAQALRKTMTRADVYGTPADLRKTVSKLLLDTALMLAQPGSVNPVSILFGRLGIQEANYQASLASDAADSPASISEERPFVQTVERVAREMLAALKLRDCQAAARAMTVCAGEI